MTIRQKLQNNCFPILLGIFTCEYLFLFAITSDSAKWLKKKIATVVFNCFSLPKAVKILLHMMKIWQYAMPCNANLHALACPWFCQNLRKNYRFLMKSEQKFVFIFLSFVGTYCLFKKRLWAQAIWLPSFYHSYVHQISFWLTLQVMSF